MDTVFAQHVETLHPSFERLVAATPFTFAQLKDQKQLAIKGVYLFTEADKPMYVGRSNDIRQWLQFHCRPGSTENQASFAFPMAREHCGVTKATYKPDGSRKHLLTQEEFLAAFKAQKARLRDMDIRVVEESNPHRQALLEMYVSIALLTPYNDFDNH